MSEFNFGDTVKTKVDTFSVESWSVIKKESVGKVREGKKIIWGREYVEVEFDKTTGLICVQNIEKIETPELVKPKFSVGDKIRIIKKEGEHNWFASTYDGIEGTITCIFEDGQVFVKTNVQDEVSFTLPTEFVEKLESENTETPKNEKKLEKITITLKNRQSAIVIIGNYLSADAEFVYYESRDGKTYEIREDEIIMIVSEEFNEG